MYIYRDSSCYLLCPEGQYFDRGVCRGYVCVYTCIYIYVYLYKLLVLLLEYTMVDTAILIMIEGHETAFNGFSTSLLLEYC